MPAQMATRRSPLILPAARREQGWRSYRDLILRDKTCIAYWALGDGTNEADLSNNSRPIAWTSTAPPALQLQPGRFGGVDCDGTEYSNTTGTTWMTGIRGVEAWVRFTSTADICILSSRITADRFAVYHTDANGLRLTTAYNLGAAATTLNSGVNVNDGVLHHVMVGFTTTTYAIFVDGISRSAGSLAQTFSPNATAGTLGVASEGASSRRWVGAIGHVACYNTIPTLAQAQEHNAAGRA